MHTYLFDFSRNLANFTSECNSFENSNSAKEETKLMSHDNNDLNDPCAIFINECMNNLKIYYNIYEKSTDIFHSLVIVINNRYLFIN
jgi:hypothetical protein